MANEYVTLDELKNSSEMTAFSFADYDADVAISAASKGIELYCGRRFWLDSSSTVVRYYTPQNGQYLNIDDASVVGTVQIDQNGDGVFETTWTLNRDYVLEPYNAATNSVPYETIRVHPASAARFVGYPRSVAVTGRFGWPAVPVQVKEATTIIASRLLRRAREAPFGIVGLGVDNTAVRISRTDPDVCFLLDELIRGQRVLAA